MPKCKDCIHSEICASHLKTVRGIYGAVMSISGREVNHLESALSEISITIGQICCDDCDHFQDRSRIDQGGGGGMSVIIKGMKFPKGCDSCDLVQDYDEDSACCPFLRSESWYGAAPDYRLEHCPLIEIPTPHGRLIDADNLKCPLSWQGEIVRATVREAPTIIEAEGSE